MANKGHKPNIRGSMYSHMGQGGLAERKTGVVTTRRSHVTIGCEGRSTRHKKVDPVQIRRPKLKLGELHDGYYLSSNSGLLLEKALHPSCVRAPLGASI